MRRKIVVLGTATAVLAVAILTGCESRGQEGGDTEELMIENAALEATEANFPGVERELWLAIAEEPGWHLEQARELFLVGDTRGAAADLVKVASILNFESRHSRSSDARQRLLASVEELREIARVVRYEDVPSESFPNVAPLDRVTARTYRAMGVHHLALAEESLTAGDALMAGRYIMESANDVEKGFVRAGVAPGPTMVQDVANARNLAEGLVNEGDGGRAEVKVALTRLAEAVHGLGEVLGSRRK